MRSGFAVLGCAVLVLASCAPSVGGRELWGREVFLPSRATIQDACNLGLKLGNDDSSKIGKFEEAGREGKIRFYSAPGQVFVSCQLFSLFVLNDQMRTAFLASPTFNDVIKESRPFVVIEGSNLTTGNTSVSIVLEDEKGSEIRSLGFSKAEGVIPGVRFDFGGLSSIPADVFDRTQSFKIVVVRGAETEQFRANADNYSALRLTRGGN